MNIKLINMSIKILCINVLTILINRKILLAKTKVKDWIFIVMSSVIITAIYVVLKGRIDNLLNIIVMYVLQLIELNIINGEKENNLIINNIISNAIIYILFCIVSFLEVPIMIIFKIENELINGIIINFLEIIAVLCFFKIKRFKRGFAFLKDNEYASIIMINISAIVILAYYLYGNYYGNMIKQLFICFVVLSIIMIIMIQKTLTLYYKQKLLAKNIEDYKSEIALKDAQIKSLSDEKYKISKLNHEFYNRQKALIHKVEEITSMNTEIADELALSKQINDLTKEYTDKAQEIKTLDKLPTTGIVEIDDMFKYMQSECDSKKIQFNLKINGNIYHMINNKIPQSRLVTLIGDHLRDAIIAIDFSNNTFKSILAVLGENNGAYEFCVFDTGIEFKIDTLLNLGLKPATTHKDSGGTGIGFMTTFETMKETKASLIIDEMREMSNTDYTKSVTIRFDGKNEYRIKSYRSDEIKKKMKDNRIIIENKKGSSTQWN